MCELLANGRRNVKCKVKGQGAEGYPADCLVCTKIVLRYVFNSQKILLSLLRKIGSRVEPGKVALLKLGVANASRMRMNARTRRVLISTARPESSTAAGHDG